jgi:hypothetical protein
MNKEVVELSDKIDALIAEAKKTRNVMDAAEAKRYPALFDPQPNQFCGIRQSFDDVVLPSKGGNMTGQFEFVGGQIPLCERVLYLNDVQTGTIYQQPVEPLSGTHRNPDATYHPPENDNLLLVGVPPVR